MGFMNRVTERFCNSPLESVPLKQYWQEKGGLLFTEFNTTYGLKGNLRAFDAIRFPDLETGAYRAHGNYEAIKSLIKNFEVELIEVHDWGFHSFGQIVGKTEIVKKHWAPKKIRKVLITVDPKHFHPKTNPDPPTQEVFKKYQVSVYIPSDRNIGKIQVDSKLF
jgi:hypothetical protein